MRRLALAVVAAALVLTGCSATQDAVGDDGEFTFVAPSGQTTISYPPAERGRVTGITGESLLNPGETISLDDYAGQVVVLNVWGSWCTPCAVEAPDLQAVQDQTADIDAVVLGIDVRDDRDNAADFIRNRGLTYDSIYDFPARTLARLDGLPRNVVPLTIVLDTQHRAAWLTLLPIRPSELIPVIEGLAAEPAAAAAQSPPP